MATGKHPEALRLQRVVKELRQRSSFRDANFRHGSLLQDLMEALSKLWHSLAHEQAPQHILMR